jgi:putative endonuclease
LQLIVSGSVVECPPGNFGRARLTDASRAGIEFQSMFFVYVIKSRNFEFLYKGHCQDLEERLKQHNAGQTKSIKSYIPFDLIYHEQFETRPEAIKREKYFKSAAGRRYLKSKLAP